MAQSTIQLSRIVRIPATGSCPASIWPAVKLVAQDYVTKQGMTAGRLVITEATRFLTITEVLSWVVESTAVTAAAAVVDQTLVP